MRKHLTTWLWYEDRLCSLSASCLVGLTLICAAGLVVLGFGLVQFWDDLAILVAENDLRSAFILAELIVLASAGLWVLSLCVATLGQRFWLVRRGR